MPASDRTLADLGESKLIERIARRAGVPSGRAWSLGIGDDAALLRTRAGEELVFSTDALVEGVHFRFEREGARRIGRRALIVNLSDLAAMGAEPVGTLLSLGAPSTLSLSAFDALIAGFVFEAKRANCPLVGGNLSRAESCSLHVTVIGRCASGRALRRGGVRPGDALYVTGTLGVGALARLAADASGGPLRFLPTARLAAGQALGRLKNVTACVDLSDGLATDLAHLLGGGGGRKAYGAEIDAGSLPAPRGFRGRCERLGVDPLEVQIGGGEDYELLFALRPSRGGPEPTVAALSSRLGVPVTRIGQVVAGSGLYGLPATHFAQHF